VNDKGIVILVNPFGHEQYLFDNLGKKWSSPWCFTKYPN
jgi:hypothetical protein